MNDVTVVYEETTRMCTDIYTKTFAGRTRWAHACNLIQITDPNTITTLMVSGALSHETPPSREGGGVVSATTNYNSSADRNSSAMPAGFGLALRRSSKLPLAKVGPLPSGLISIRSHHIDDIRDCPAYRDWDMFVKFHHGGDNGAGAFGVYSRRSCRAMSFDSEKLPGEINDVSRNSYGDECVWKIPLFSLYHKRSMQQTRIIWSATGRSLGRWSRCH